MTTKKVATLVIHAPQYKRGKKPFQAVLADGVGVGYIIYESDKSKLQVPGSTVVLLANDLERRAEGVLDKLCPTVIAKNGQQRYNVHIKGLTEVHYKPEELNRCGVAVVDC
ncbi:MAG: hypothetical protein Q8O16_05955 [Dehalococcoidia bacterium]|nr:hypothetical protein [Dehalococcoidia bacterium]